MKVYKTLIFISFCFILIMTFYSCNRVIYTKNYSIKPNSSNDSKVYLFLKRDSLPENVNIIADVDIRESWSLDYKYLKSKIDRMVREKGGNLFKVREFYVGQNTKGASGRILGTIYYAPENNINMQLITNNLLHLNGDSTIAVVYIYKEDRGIPALSAPSIYVNKKLLGDLKNKTFLRYQTNASGIITFSTGNPVDNQINVTITPGNVYYLKVTKKGETYGTAGGYGAQLSGNYFILSQAEEGRFNFDNFLNSME